MTKSTEKELYEQWRESYALRDEPNYSVGTDHDCKAAFIAGMQAARRAQVVPHGWKLAPVELLERATESLGSFVSDHGWGQADMDTFDDLSALAAAPQPPACNPSMQPELATKAAPVQMPEPFGVAHSGQLDNVKDGYAYVYPVGSVGANCKLYTEHQVRQLLADRGMK